MNINSIYRKRLESGFNLIELMIGIAIGSLILLAALTALVSTSSTGRTVNDASQIQQQGSIALRIIGLQIRQAAARNLVNLAGGPVFLSENFAGFADGGNAIQGVNGGTTDTLNISYEGTSDSTDCLGNTSALALGRVDSAIAVNGTTLECTGSAAAGAQVIVDGVEDFQVRYGVKAGTSMQYVNTTANWGSVSAVEVCLQLRSATVTAPAIGTYTNCQGNVVAQDGRLHKMFRNTFLLRNQDL